MVQWLGEGGGGGSRTEHRSVCLLCSCGKKKSHMYHIRALLSTYTYKHIIIRY